MLRRGGFFDSKWLGVAFVVAVLLVWQVVTVSGMLELTALPPVLDILAVWWRVLVSGELLKEIGPSLGRMLAGYLLAVIGGVAVGMFMGLSRWGYHMLEPMTELLRPIPSPAYVPIAILFLGLGDEMKVAIIALASFFPVLVNTYSGVRGVDLVLIKTGETLGLSRGMLLRKIIFPASLPYILTGMRISVSIAMVMIVISEMVAATSGIGFYILLTQRTFEVHKMYAGIFTLAILGYLLNSLLVAIERRVLHWHTRDK
jgi:ABC-type nitrate/sulfonate/bicarbonate transport system permease component